MIYIGIPILHKTAYMEWNKKQKKRTQESMTDKVNV